MSFDIGHSYLYENLPKIYKTSAKAGFQPYAVGGTDLFPTTVTLRDNTYPGRYFPDLAHTRQRVPIEYDLRLQSKYVSLEPRTQRSLDQYSMDELVRIAQTKNIKAARERIDNFPNEMQKFCEGCYALPVGGTAGCNRFSNYSLQDSVRKMPRYQSLPMAPYGRRTFNYLREQLDRTPTNNFTDCTRYT